MFDFLELNFFLVWNLSQPKCIFNPIMAMGFSAMFTFQLDNTAPRGKHCQNPITILGVVDTFMLKFELEKHCQDINGK